MQYAEIITDHKAGYEPLTYAIPPELLAHLQPGSVVLVPIGKQTVHGIVYRFVRRVEPRLQTKLKPIASLIYEGDFIPEYVLEAASRLHEQYGYHLGEILFSFLPPWPRKPQISAAVHFPDPPEYSLTEYVLPLHSRVEAYSQIARATFSHGLSFLILCPSQATVMSLTERLEANGLDCLVYPSPPTPKAQKEFFLTVRNLATSRVIIGTRGALMTPLQAVGRVLIEEPWFPGHKEERSPRLWTALAAQALCFTAKVPLAVTTTISWPDTQLLGQSKRYTVKARYGHLQLVPNRSISEAMTHWLASFDEPGRSLAIVIRENTVTFYWCPACHKQQTGEMCAECQLPTITIPPLTRARIEAQLALIQPQSRISVRTAEEMLHYRHDDALLALGFDALLAIVDFRSPVYLSSLLFLLRSQATVTYFATSFPDSWTQINHQDLTFFTTQAVTERRIHQLPPYSLAVQCSARETEALSKLPPLSAESIIQQGRIRQEGQEFIQSYLLRRAFRLPKTWHMSPDVKIDIFPNYIHTSQT